MASLSGVNRIEVRARKDDGQLIFLESSGSMINYMDKEIMAFLFYDVTSRKKTEQALEQSINRFKGLVENSPNAVFILTDGKIKYSNQSGTKLLGYRDEDDVFDLEFVSLFPSQFRKEVQSDLNLVRDGEEVDYRELVIRDSRKKELDVGVKLSLTVYDNRPSIQVTINNLSTERLLFQEKSRAQLAEEINNVLKREIEEHKNTQNKLLQAQKFTRNIIESSLDMIIAVDKNMKVSEFNTSARTFFGYTADEILGKPIRRLFADKKSWDRVDEELMANGYFSGEVENIKKSGEVFTSFLSASLIRAQDGTILGSMGVSRDITEMKKAEKELRASEERYRDIFENVLDYILSIDLDGTILYANRSFLDNLGYTRTELEELNIFDLCDPGQLQADKKLIDQLSGQNLSLIIRDKDGNKLLLKGNTNIKYENDKAVSIRAIFRNVTEVVEQRAKLESIFNSTENILMWTVDKDKRISSFNKNLKKVWENEFGEEIQKRALFIDIIEKSLNKDLYQGQLERYNKTFNGEPQQFEIPLLNKDGENVWLQFFLNPVYYEGNLEEVSCMAYDVTDRKEIDRRILDALKEKEVLLQEVHHRVKNNLQVISSILNLQSSYVNDTETLEVLKESQNRIKSMSYIHETLYQTADFGSIEFSDYISVIVRNLIHSYTTDTPVEYKPKLDRLCLGLDQAIPCGLIINELVSNALKYAFDGIDKPKMIVEFCEDKEQLMIRVKDNGIGLPQDFAYEESNSLGIQLVYSLVEQLDGQLEINTDLGTEFIIRFEKID
jgi:PAS domain S-box-containing protein